MVVKTEVMLLWKNIIYKKLSLTWVHIQRTDKLCALKYKRWSPLGLYNMTEEKSPVKCMGQHTLLHGSFHKVWKTLHFILINTSRDKKVFCQIQCQMFPAISLCRGIWTFCPRPLRGYSIVCKYKCCLETNIKK